MPNKSQAFNKQNTKPVLSIENFDTMTLEERLALIDEIGSDLMNALSRTFIKV